MLPDRGPSEHHIYKQRSCKGWFAGVQVGHNPGGAEIGHHQRCINRGGKSLLQRRQGMGDAELSGTGKDVFLALHLMRIGDANVIDPTLLLKGKILTWWEEMSESTFGVKNQHPPSPPTSEGDGHW